MDTNFSIDKNAIAIIGMSLRFPGASDVDTFWENLKTGKESISRFTKEELLAAGEPLEKIEHPNYVNAHGWIDGLDLFDASFFWL